MRSTICNIVVQLAFGNAFQVQRAEFPLFVKGVSFPALCTLDQHSLSVCCHWDGNNTAACACACVHACVAFENRGNFFLFV